jgi:hypothetical protein
MAHWYVFVGEFIAAFESGIGKSNFDSATIAAMRGN